MKARTKAQKLAQRRGRPKMENVTREPNGRISRSGIEAPNVVMLNARKRLFGLNDAQAGDQRAETFIGILSMRGEKRGGISEAHYQALLQFVALRDAFMRTIKAPDAGKANQVSGSAGEAVSDEYVAWCQTTKERYKAVRDDIQRAYDNSRKPLWQALHMCVVDDKHMEIMVDSLRIVSGVLVEHFGGLTDRRKSANY